MDFRVRRFAVSVVGLTALALPLSASTISLADAAAPAKRYPRCKALQQDYPHGVAKSGARDKVRGKTKPVKNFTVNTRVYNLNNKRDKFTGEYDLDRDNDGVACEKR